MKKISLTILTAVSLLVGSQVQALPINASGAGGVFSMENSQMHNTNKTENERDAQICQGGICNIADGTTISGAGGVVDMKNSTMTNNNSSSNGRNNQICQAGICNVSKK